MREVLRTRAHDLDDALLALGTAIVLLMFVAEVFSR